MHLTTRCPACGTMFRVVPDQLKISDGWVRCGHCADVFDATLYLETWKPPAASGVDERMPIGETAATAADVQPSGLGSGFELPLAAQRIGKNREDTAVGVDSMPAKPEQTHPKQKPLQTHTYVDTTIQAASTRAQIGVERILVNTAGAVSQPMATQIDAVVADPVGTEPVGSSPQPIANPELQANEPSFVQQARRRAFWHSSGVRALLSVTALMLTLLLGLQFVLHERDALAAWQPRWAPALKQLCEPLGCEVAAVRRIDAIVIDSSTLVHRLGNFYSFDLVLQNTAPVALAVPALELSLTDTRDAVIARRVFLPEELPGAPALLPAKNAVTISLRLSLAVGESTPMAGYRALVFYP